MCADLSPRGLVELAASIPVPADAFGPARAYVEVVQEGQDHALYAPCTLYLSRMAYPARRDRQGGYIEAPLSRASARRPGLGKVAVLAGRGRPTVRASSGELRATAGASRARCDPGCGHRYHGLTPC